MDNLKDIKDINVKRRKKLTVKDIVKEVLFDLTLFLAVLFILKYVAFFGYVPTGSMEPTIKEGSKIVVWQLDTYFKKNKGLSHGDIVVFYGRAEDGLKNTKLVKRVIGLPGDKVELKNGVVYLNDEELNEPYVPDLYKSNLGSFVVNIGKDEILVLGDNRAVSFDARYWEMKTIPLDNVIGKVLFK